MLRRHPALPIISTILCEVVFSYLEQVCDKNLLNIKHCVGVGGWGSGSSAHPIRSLPTTDPDVLAPRQYDKRYRFPIQRSIPQCVL